MPRKTAQSVHHSTAEVEALKAEIASLKETSSSWKTDSMGWRINHEVKFKDLELQVKTGFAEVKENYANGQSEQNKKLDALVEAEKERVTSTRERDKLLASMERWIKVIGGSGTAVGAMYATWEILHKVWH